MESAPPINASLHGQNRRRPSKSALPRYSLRLAVGKLNDRVMAVGIASVAMGAVSRAGDGGGPEALTDHLGIPAILRLPERSAA